MSNEVETDSFVESVFEGTPEATDADTGLTSWDEVDKYVEEASPENSETAEESSEESGVEAPQSEDKSAEQPEDESNKSSDQDGSEDDSQGEQSEEEAEAASFEIPEQLAEKGLIASEEGEIGKMVKIDGEMQFVPLDELGNDYSGQKALQKRFTEYDQQNKAFKAELDEVNGYVNNFRDKMQEEGPLEAMSYLGQFSNMAPYQIKRQLMEQLAPEIDRLRNMSNAELQAEYATQEKEYLQQSLESEREASSAKQAEMELQQEITSVREAHSIDDSEWDQAIEFLREHESQIRAQDPNVVMDAKYVAETVMEARAYGRAESALEVASVNLSPEQSESILGNLQDLAYQNPDFTQEDLVEIVKGALNQAVESKVSDSLGKRVEKHGDVPAKEAPKDNSNVSPQEQELFDELWG
jgi:hypothetical protein